MKTTEAPPLFWTRRTRRGRIKLTGRDRQSFLQGMVSNDVAALAPGTGCYAFMLQATGQVIGDMRVLCTPDYLLLDVEPEQAAFVCETLEKYLIMEKCRITDVSGETSQILVGGTNAPAFFAQRFSDGWQNWNTEHWQEGQNASAEVKQAALVARTVLAAVPAYDVYLSDTDSTGELIELLAQEHAAEITEADLEDLRIAFGIPRFGVDIDSTVLAPETGQAARAISYRKGCYIGQEIVSRIHARGHTNRAFVGFVVPDGAEIAPGAIVSAGENANAGRVTSVSAPFVLGYVRHEFTASQTPVTINGHAAHVSALPFSTENAEVAL